jgi:hypothetical protein
MESAVTRMRMPDYLTDQLEEMAKKPTLGEWFERLQSRTRVDPGFSTAEVIRELRGPLPADDPTGK